jgi:hypothetical protein
MSDPEDEDLATAEVKYLETRRTELDAKIHEAFHEPGALAELRAWVGRPALELEALTIDDVRALVQCYANLVSSCGDRALAHEYLAVYERYLVAAAHRDDLVAAGATHTLIDAAQAACDEIDEQVDRVQAAVIAYLKTKD